MFLHLDGIQLTSIFNQRTAEPIDINLAIMDLQADFQINKAFNKACIVAQRQLKQNNQYSRLYFWANAQAEPFLKIEVNFFIHSNTQLINIGAMMSKIIVNLDGAAFSRLFPLANLLVNILMQGQHVFFTETPQNSEENLEEGVSHQKSKNSLQKKYNINVRECDIDLFLEKAPELISSLSNDYVAKIISMLFSDICYFPIKIKEFNIDAVRFSNTRTRLILMTTFKNKSSNTTHRK